MPVNTRHPDYDKMLARWQRCRDVTDGQDAVHAAADKYLPRLKDQPNEDYLAYVMRTPFYNASWRTIAGLVGMVFRKDPKVEVPKPVEDMFKDVTLSGIPLDLFLRTVSEEALKLGRVGVLVDYPRVDANKLTMADAKRLNLRPTMQFYIAENCINWKMDRVNNMWTLVQVVLKECAYVDTDEFTHKEEERFRVLDLIDGRYRVRMFKVEGAANGQGGTDVMLDEFWPLKGGAPLDYIPFTFLSTDDNANEIDEPPLIDLININLSHYRTSADLEHGAHFTGLPTPVVAGYKPEKDGEKLYIGSATAWVFPDPTATATYLEFKGEGLGALEKLKAVKEQQMAVLGARMLEAQKRGVESADSQSIHRKGEESMLAAASKSISISMTRVIVWFCDWAGSPKDDALLELNSDFYPVAMTDKMLTALVSAWQQGAFSMETLFDNLQAGEIISPETTLEEEQAKLADEQPKLTGQQTDPATGLPKPVQPLGQPKEPPAPGERNTTITTPKGEQYKITHS